MPSASKSPQINQLITYQDLSLILTDGREVFLYSKNTIPILYRPTTSGPIKTKPIINMKSITVKIPTHEDIKPAAKDTANAIVDAATCLPTLGVTILTSGISLLGHVVSETKILLIKGGEKLHESYKIRELKKATKIVMSHMDDEQAAAYEKAQKDTDVPF